MSRDSLYKGRTSIPSQVYHITTCTQNRHHLFVDLQSAKIVITEMNKLSQENKVMSLAWVLMPDHLHWLLQLSGQQSLSQLIKDLKGRSSIKLNRHLGRTGKCWQRGFHDHAIRGEKDIKKIARYIIANPLRAGIVTNIGDYPFWDATWL